MQISEMQKQIKKTIFISYIIAFELFCGKFSV